MKQEKIFPEKFSHPLHLQDRFGRKLTYLRLSVTDRCNLRCRYCMPESGIPLRPRQEMLTWEEMERLVRLFARMGVRKLRLTGGEPFVRKGIVAFLRRVRAIPGLEGIYVTTNGVALGEFIQDLKGVGVSGINLSLDTLKPERFRQLARRDAFERVWDALQNCLEAGLSVKLNCVVQRGFNEDEIVALARLAQKWPLEVRFIEEMPFDGQGVRRKEPLSAEEIQARLEAAFPGIQADGFSGTAQRFSVPGFRGKLGIIAGYSRHFCSDCSRIRVSANGLLRTCLYGPARLNLRDRMRSGATDAELARAIQNAVWARQRDGFEAAKEQQGTESMVRIGG